MGSTFSGDRESAFTYRRFSTCPPLDGTSMVNAGTTFCAAAGLAGNADEVKPDHGTHLQSSPRSPIWPEKRDFRAILALKMPLRQPDA
jgi:hypothetical protein